MNYRKIINYSLMVCLLAAVLLLVAGSSSQANAKPKDPPNNTVGCRGNNGQGKGQGKCPKEEHDNRQAAAARAYQQGMLNPLMVEAQAAAALIDGAPHYFSHPNYANSQLPTVEGTLTYFGNALQDRQYASDYPVGVGELAPVLVVLPTALPDGFLTSFQTWNQAAPAASPFPSAGNIFHAYVLRPTGNPDEYTVVFDSGELTVPTLTDPAVSEVATFGVANLDVQAGDRLAFYGQGVPLDGSGGSDILVYNPDLANPVLPPLADPLVPITLDSPGYPIYNQVRTYAFGAQVIDTSNTTITGGIRKFVDGMAGLGPDGANNLGQYISVAVPDQTTYSTANGFGADADYYEIAVVEFQEQMHTDLPATTHRGYVQLETNVVTGAHVALTNPDGSPILMPDGSQAYAVDNPHYLGATIVANKDKPVRIKFYNLLPTGADGNLFIPVDSTVMGSGGGQNMPMMDNFADPQNPLCSSIDPISGLKDSRCYTENRATLHLHGGISPWISDGTPHQWITPANETTPYPQGVSVGSVPDMDGCDLETDGCMTFYYTNQQSARLMFYHDHAWGITRLNVYAGEAAGYLLTDETDQALMAAGGALEGLGLGIPLVIQDKTFVPSQAQLDWQDETWDSARWGGDGSLWVPHVYSPAQNPGDASGVNEFGRWAYGPWFWPPTNAVDYPPIDNIYYDPACDPDLGWCEPPLMPSTPYISMGMESFNDTPIVNGTVYPTLTLEPKPYRFRILSVANDRFFNFSFYKAVDANGVLCDTNNPNPTPESTGIACTEVMLNPDEVAAALGDPAGVFPTPVVGTEGPNWIQIGTEGGFLPAPVEIPAQYTTWVTDPTVFNAGNVDQHSLLLAPAERADVVVDFSDYAGQTLILYNDAPAAFPARDPRYDYYTGNPDLRDTGGAPSTLPGYGPNTRTIMQIKIAGTPSPAFDLGALQAAFAHQADGSGVFESGQNPIIVGQKGANNAYNDAYGTSFTGSDGLVQIHDTSLTFKTILGDTLSMSLKGKMIQDEMGEAFENEYGRMSGFLGVETPNPQAGLQNMILHPYVYPPDEILRGVVVDGTDNSLDVTPIASTDDGTQIWKITHNGVDTHPIHVHLYEVQLLNRVGWDGIIRKPDANELGWKDTVRVSPLEDTIVALRPILPHLPAAWNGLPNSIRLLDPALPEGEYLHHANTTQQEALGLPILSFNPDGEPVDIVNHYVNFGWEYVYHCHILSHEEMDMMHPQVVGVAPEAPGPVTATRGGNGNNQYYDLTWDDNSKNETGTVIERRVAGSTDAWTEITTVPSLGNDGPDLGTRNYRDLLGNDKTLYEYQTYAINVVGDTWDYSNPALNEIPPGGGWPTLTLDSRGGALSTIEAPTELSASAVAKNKKTAIVTLNWTDNSVSPAAATGFLIQRADNAAFSLGVVDTTVGNVTTVNETVARGKTYYYRVLAFNDATQSDWSNTATVTTP
ncbi:MAG: multicopper oxidase domain-containing protein [Candidatus Promineifilaceae bacterium]|jgi:FtsP/CotA-like multicopper oxidase with cupredoxin domain